MKWDCHRDNQKHRIYWYRENYRYNEGNQNLNDRKGGNGTIYAADEVLLIRHTHNLC